MGTKKSGYQDTAKNGREIDRHKQIAITTWIQEFNICKLLRQPIDNIRIFFGYCMPAKLFKPGE